MSIKELASLTASSVDPVREALRELAADLEGRGLSLVEEGDRVALATAPETKAVIETMRREELEGPVGKAGLETLAVIVYRGPVSRADIEYVRGVNVTSSLRTLLIRGLIERVDNPKDKRSFLYRATTDLPAYLGVARLTDLPDFARITDDIKAVLEEKVLEPDAAVES